MCVAEDNGHSREGFREEVDEQGGGGHLRHRQGRQRPGGCRLGLSLKDTAGEGGEEEEAEDDLLLWIG